MNNSVGSVHWTEFIATLLSLLGSLWLTYEGFLYMTEPRMDAGGNPQSDSLNYILIGIVVLGLSIWSFVLTGGWTHVSDLSFPKKFVAYVPVIITILVILVVRLAWSIVTYFLGVND